MNTQTLREKFKEVYRDFFSRCELVVSAPFNTAVTGDYIASNGGLVLHHKLPIRLYVGFELTPAVNRLSFGSQRSFTQLVNNGAFIDRRIDPIYETHFLNFLEKILYQTPSKSIPHYTLHLLAEAPLAIGLGDSGALGAAMAVGVSLVNRSITIQEIDGWRTKNLLGLINDQNFDRVFRLAWHLRVAFRGGRGSGHAVLTALVDSYYPIIFWNKRLPKQPLPKQIDDCPYFAYRFEDFLDQKTPMAWPYDFGLIHSGAMGNTSMIIRGMDVLERILAETANATNQLFAQPPFKGLDDLSSIFRRSAIPDYYQIPRFLSMRAMLTLRSLFEQGISDDRIEDFFQTINLYQDSLRLLGASNRVIEGITASFRERSRLWRLPHAATKIVGGGSYVLFMTPTPELQSEISSLIEELRQRFDPRIHLAYASWLDGYDFKGVRVEQMVSDNIYSPLISHGALLVDYLTIQGDLQNHIYAREHFQKFISPKQEITFDAIGNTVIIRGERLTSQEIHSATATIQIFEILVKQCGKAVKNTDLPESIYAQDRNELQSKIISPLNQAVVKRLGRRLPVKITGGVTECTITLQPGLPIYFIKKVF